MNPAMMKMLAVSGGVLSLLGGLALLVKALGNINLRLTLDLTRAEKLPVRAADADSDAAGAPFAVRMTRGASAGASAASSRPASPVVVESARTGGDADGRSEPVRPHLTAEPRPVRA